MTPNERTLPEWFPAYRGLNDDGDSSSPYFEGWNDAIDACAKAYWGHPPISKRENKYD